MAVKVPWLELGAPILALAAWEQKILLSPCTGGSFLYSREGLGSGCLTTESVYYCMYSLINGLRFSFGVRAWTEMEIWCVKGMYRLK